MVVLFVQRERERDALSTHIAVCRTFSSHFDPHSTDAHSHQQHSYYDIEFSFSLLATKALTVLTHTLLYYFVAALPTGHILLHRESLHKLMFQTFSTQAHTLCVWQEEEEDRSCGEYILNTHMNGRRADFLYPCLKYGRRH